MKKHNFHFNVGFIVLLLVLGITLVSCRGLTEINGTAGRAQRDEIRETAPRVDFDISRILITEIAPDSPAQYAGLLPNEIILRVEGEEIRSARSFASLIASFAPGDIITLEVQHFPDGAVREVKIELGEHPEEPGKAYIGVGYSQVPSFTFEFEPPNGSSKGDPVFPFAPNTFVFPFMEGFDLADPPFQHFYELLPGPFEGALILVDVVDGSPADQAGLREGDLIIALNGEAVLSAQAFVDSLHKMTSGDEVIITYFSLGERQSEEAVISLGTHPEHPDLPYLGVILGGLLQFEPFRDWPEGHSLDLMSSH